MTMIRNSRREKMRERGEHVYEREKLFPLSGMRVVKKLKQKVGRLRG